jgi:hypothetical protein
VGAAAGFCVAASTAAAEVGAPTATVQAIAADAQFLEYAPPPAAPGVVCLIDSGVDPNPDTTPILAGSYAIQGGTDTSDELSKLDPPVEPGDHPNGHGTYMAMIMAAPVNGWGMVGIAPTSVRVFNFKALAEGHTTFPYAVYANAIVECLDRPAGITGLTVVNLSLGTGTAPTQADVDAIENAAADAGRHNVNVVGAAGNDGGLVSYPAAATGVMAVGATDANPADLGVFCPTSDRGPALALLGPGCGTQSEPAGGGGGVDVAFSDTGEPAWASGTSDASAIVASVLASMRAYAPSLTATQAEQCLTSTTVNGGNLDAAAAFRACGLGAIVSQGFAAYQDATMPSSPLMPPAPASSPSPVPALPAVTNSSNAAGAWAIRPRVLTVAVRGGRTVVKVASVPAGARVRVDAERQLPAGGFRVIASTTAAARTATLAVSSWDRLAVVFVKTGKRSDAAYVRRKGALSARAASLGTANGQM